MSLIAKTARKSVRGRLLILSMYLLLTAGAATMVYPFLLMLSGSTRSALDAHESNIIPTYLIDPEQLYRKFAEGFFNESLAMARITLQTNLSSFTALRPPAENSSPLLPDWQHFLQQEAPGQLSFIYTPVSRGVMPLNLRAFKKQIAEQYSHSIQQVNQQLGTTYASWNTLFILPRNPLARRTIPEHTPLLDACQTFSATRPITQHFYPTAEGYFRYVYLRALYNSSITRYNTAHQTSCTTWNDVLLPEAVPSANESPLTRTEWLEFTRTILNPTRVTADPAARSPYQQFLQTKYRTIIALNRHYQTHFNSFAEIPLFHQLPLQTGLPYADWAAFVQGWTDPDSGTLYQLPAANIRLTGPAFRFRQTLQQSYGSLDQLNTSLRTSYPDWKHISPPQNAALHAGFLQSAPFWKKEFTTRNFRSVLNYILLHGRALLNTVIYCGLSILLALIVNPLAAYALSRYRPPSAYPILLFLMVTMAFPPMVTQIPAFLMLRELHLLNSYWALVLPSMANGFSIFLLKGFFDSLPRDLYDSAALDGAGEITIFWHITMSLSKPILAVIALNAFTLAYSNFMMALLFCQDQKMWTLMPWLYQLQQRSSSGIIFASLLLAAIPTFIIFSFCQNIIIRGIVVPVEK